MPGPDTRDHRYLFLLSIFLLMLMGAPAVTGRVIEVAPGDDYRTLLDSLEPGDELVFLPGVHEGAAVLRASGTAADPITIRGRIEDGRRPEVRFIEAGHNLWWIRASHLRVRDLTLHASHGYAIRIGQADDITIENVHFRDNGGGDISANTGHVHGLRIRDSRFTGTRLTPVYIGNHQGALEITGFVFERNVMNGSSIEPAANTVGYAIQLKQNVRGGIIRDNFITTALGPGIMVYGSEDPEPGDASLIERNIIVGSRENAGLIVGAGPATVRNNIVLGCEAGGIQVFNYNQWNMLEGIEITGNVAAMNRPYDFRLARPLIDFVARGNRAWHASGAAGFRDLPDNSDGLDNSATAAGEPLRDLVDRLPGVTPSHETLNPIWQSLDNPPATQAELTALLAPLIGPEL